MVTNRNENNESTGCVVWFTGLSGAGKTTTALQLLDKLRASGIRAELLDGDDLRAGICKGLGFSREDRMENISRIVYVSELLARNGVVTIVSAITPYKEMRDYARSKIASYIEVFVDTPLAECERRDVKGLYAKARNHEIPRFTGISDPYEEPEHPDITLKAHSRTVEENVDLVLEWLHQSGYLPLHWGELV